MRVGLGRARAHSITHTLAYTHTIAHPLNGLAVVRKTSNCCIDAPSLKGKSICRRTPRISHFGTSAYFRVYVHYITTTTSETRRPTATKHTRTQTQRRTDARVTLTTNRRCGVTAADGAHRAAPRTYTRTRTRTHTNTPESPRYLGLLRRRPRRCCWGG